MEPVDLNKLDRSSDISNKDNINTGTEQSVSETSVKVNNNSKIAAANEMAKESIMIIDESSIDGAREES